MAEVAVELEVIRFGRIKMPHDYVVRPPGRRLSRWLTGFRPGVDAFDGSCLAFVVRHPAVGVILVDTGLHPGAYGRVAADFGFPTGWMFRGLEPIGTPFDQALRQRGVDPAAVEQVVMTHLHVDHTSGIRLLPRAEFILAKAEWAAACRRTARLKGYNPDHLPDAGRTRLVDLEHQGVPHGPLTHTVDLLGDGTMRLAWTPGHTPGHLSVVVRTRDRGEVLLVGDAAYTEGNIRRQALPLITVDDTQARRSLAQLNAYADAHPSTLLVPSHDPTAWHQLT